MYEITAFGLTLATLATATLYCRRGTTKIPGWAVNLSLIISVKSLGSSQIFLVEISKKKFPGK